LLEYGDYECPYCGSARHLVKLLEEALGDELCFAYRNFPLSSIHPHAQQAAEAAEAAGAQGRFWEMHDALFENQDALELDDLAFYAADIGLDANRLVAEIESGRYRPRVHADVQSGIRSGVSGTPTFLINEILYDGPVEPEAMLAALRESEYQR
jgi:protein-disulfide isomerase